MTKITSLDATNTGYVQFTTEDGESVSAPVIANADGCSIINVEVGGVTVAMQVIDYGDGDAEVHEMGEGETFDAEHRGQYVVRRDDGADAGSLMWQKSDV